MPTITDAASVAQAYRAEMLSATKLTGQAKAKPLVDAWKKKLSDDADAGNLALNFSPQNGVEFTRFARDGDRFHLSRLTGAYGPLGMVPINTHNEEEALSVAPFMRPLLEADGFTLHAVVRNDESSWFAVVSMPWVAK